ncbi:hypothetical protein CLAFUW4_08667 [Fulvia fulva]|uniref:Uncharacterized protein n=1 Tax=Passalora fulva TaxID=5499 RepID=A0A9Q8P774_PASFU|nr:uncharacterized protein CLAFUR5_08766 [Fulvia fulva]KAK4629087.1 hypothetical protein CLAFUR4_08669 [Fulvia fulva]KAK4630481.1 hypothetical protein CLAFUR0_08665 [Fulvia fulva]UJO15602.1 hypothetical protein CLAFUR5_08766 [Fulvia fulva]WPV12092.1 hypothetical protein CLAFUW4_08667 [Fulvia fulva]WPV27018.1 hypothetical protein CLAFUW7_08664 [Fulvia fulva]
MKFAAVSLALLGASAVQGLATPATFGNAVQARQISGGINGIGAIVITLEDVIDSLIGLTTETIGAVSDAVNSAIGTATDAIGEITDALPTVSKRQADAAVVLARLNALIDRLQVQASILTGTALSTVNNLINQIQLIITSLTLDATTPL